MMNTEVIPTQNAPLAISPLLESRLANHRAHLGSKYAFLFNQEVINKVKHNSFTKPARRETANELDHKIENEASTSAGSLESDLPASPQLASRSPVLAASVAAILREAVVQEPRQTGRVLETLSSFEDFLGAEKLVSAEVAAHVRTAHRESVAAVHAGGSMGCQPQETALAVILFTAERLGLEVSWTVRFCEAEPSLRRFNKLASIRSHKSFKVLTTCVGRKASN